MRAVEVARFGGPEVLRVRELPDPAPRPGHVVIAAVASDVLFVDTLIRSGRGVDAFPVRPPYVPGNGAGGVVVALGEGVDASWMGREVVAHTGGRGGGGGYAELVSAEVASCAAVPEGVDLSDATAVLHDGTTALRVLETTGVSSGEWVLVLGAAGGMGLVLVQLLAARGAHVVGAARGRAKLDVIRQAGAAATVDYSHAGWTDVVVDVTGARRPQVVLDGVGGQLGGAAFELIADGGRFSAHGTASGTFAAADPSRARDRGVTLTSITDLRYGDGDRPRLLSGILQAILVGTLSPLVGQVFPLAEASIAHAALEGRETVGKTLLVSD